MNKAVISILTIFLILSIGTNVYFLSGKGITINQDKSNHQYQQQWQGQLMINQWTAQGNKIEWKTIIIETEKVPEELNKLHPISAMYAKVMYLRDISGSTLILYPDIFQEKK